MVSIVDFLSYIALRFRHEYDGNFTPQDRITGSCGTQ